MVLALIFGKGKKKKKKSCFIITSHEMLFSVHKGGLKPALGVFSSKCSTVAGVPCSESRVISKLKMTPCHDLYVLILNKCARSCFLYFFN
jgi:hypothetical protein